MHCLDRFTMRAYFFRYLPSPERFHSATLAGLFPTARNRGGESGDFDVLSVHPPPRMTMAL